MLIKFVLLLQKLIALTLENLQTVEELATVLTLEMKCDMNAQLDMHYSAQKQGNVRKTEIGQAFQ